MISAKILADSVNTQGDRLTTMEIVLPRIILAEAKTHRIISGLGEQVEVTQSLGLNDEFNFSRNSASSRAIPFNKMVKMVEENPFIPLAVQYDHKGMQGSSYFGEREYEAFVASWLHQRDLAVRSAQQLHGQGATKQLCNRLLEPFMYHKVIVTATEWENFFELRCPKYTLLNHSVAGRQEKVYKSKKDAELAFGSELNQCADELGFYPDDPMFWLTINKSQADIHIQAVAECMWDVMSGSTPKKLQPGEYHLPFGDNISSDVTLYSKDPEVQVKLWGKDLIDLQIKIAVARCARISYETLGDNPKIDYEADIRLHDNLLEMKHFSPMEHVARCMTEEEYLSNVKGELGYEEIIREPGFETNMFYSGSDVSSHATGWCRNFRGFIQYRSLVDNQ